MRVAKRVLMAAILGFGLVGLAGVDTAQANISSCGSAPSNPPGTRFCDVCDFIDGEVDRLEGEEPVNQTLIDELLSFRPNFQSSDGTCPTTPIRDEPLPPGFTPT